MYILDDKEELNVLIKATPHLLKRFPNKFLCNFWKLNFEFLINDFLKVFGD